jgi:hypothetical protein
MSDELVEIIGRAITGEDRADIIGARAVLAALEAAGMVVVPREPTEEMLAAGAVAEGDGNLETQAMNLWAAMLAASPKKG